MRSQLALLLALSLLWAAGTCSSARADSFDYDPTAARALGYLEEWSAGLLGTTKAVTQLREVVEDVAATGHGRATALRCLAWLDIYSDDVDVRDLMSAVAARKDIPTELGVAAITGQWDLIVFGRHLDEAAQIALLRRIAQGHARGRQVTPVGRQWAAAELCARGLYDDEVRRTLEWRFEETAGEHEATCERQQQFIRGEKDARTIEAAFRIVDLSHSQSFRRIVIESALARTEKGAEYIPRIGMSFVGRGDPAIVLATRRIVRELVDEGATTDELTRRGVSPEVASVVSRAVAKRRLHSP